MVMERSLVGRDAELSALRALLAVSRGGQARLVVLSGEAGAGKTVLAEQALAAAAIPVLRSRASARASQPYELIATALRPAIRAAGGSPPAILSQVLPELGPPTADQGQDALAAAMRAVLDGLTGERGLALFLDDLQWADEASLTLLPSLAEALGGLPVVMLGCYRSDELPRGHRLRTVRAELRRRHQFTEIELRPLDDDHVRLVLARLLEAEPQPTLTAAVASRADGLPFAVEELAFALRDAGRLAYQDGTVTLAGTGAAPVPEGIREAVLLRASRLSNDERALLEAAAVAGIDFDIDAVLAVASRPGWPDGFTAAGLLTEASDGRSAFRHPLTQEAAYSDIPWSRRRRLHRAMAATMAGADAPPGLIASHHLAARDFGPARQALLAAAEQHWAVHAYRDAARALRIALEHWPPSGDDDARLAAIGRLARCAEMCSEYADAIMLLRELAEGQERRDDRRALGATCRRLALIHELRGQWEPALTARLAAASAFTAAGDPAEAAIDRLAMAAHLRSAASYSAALDTLTQAMADAKAAGRADLMLRVQGLRGNVLSRFGKPSEGIADVQDALDQALAASLPAAAAELQQRLADSLEHSGDYRAATAAYAAAFQYCDVQGADAVGQLCRACATAVLFARGEWDRVISLSEDVLAGDPAPHAFAVGTGLLGLVQAMRGKPARSRLLESQVTATRIELTAMELISGWGLCVLDTAAGAGGQAADRGRQLLARLAKTQERHYSVPILQWLTTFFAERGDAADVGACAAALTRIAEATGQPEAVAALAHARGEALLPDDPAAAARELGTASEMFSKLELPLQAAQSQRRAAAAALNLGDDDHARQLLRDAHATASRLGAVRLTETIAAALRELGERPGGGQSRRRPAVAGLTRRELDVMRLVAQGETSRQIGSALFISPRTVEMHVHGSMRKLGCRTRAQAVRRLAELRALDPASRPPADQADAPDAHAS